MPGQCPSTVRESLWQTPHASMRTRTCPGPGSATSRSTSSNGILGSATWKARDRGMEHPHHELRGALPKDSIRSGRVSVLKPSLAGPHQACGAGGAEAAENLEDAPALLVVGDEEVLGLLEQVFRHVLERLELAIGARLGRDTDQPVVAIRLSFLGLVRFQNADQSDWDETTGEEGFLHQDQHVDGISFCRGGRGDRTEVEREDGARRKNMGDRVAALREVELELDRASFRGIDHDMEKAR